MSDPIPVVVCGALAAIVAGIVVGLQPEYEGATDIPLLIQGQSPPSESEDNVGTKNYSKPPVAIVMGAAYDDEKVEEMRAACTGKGSLPWLRFDTAKPTPPMGPEFGKAIVARVKVCLKELSESGAMGKDGIYWY